MTKLIIQRSQQYNNVAMGFNYEQSIWGKGTASLKWSDPASFRLRQVLLAIRSLPSKSKILEVGCGAGQFIRAIKNYRPDLICCGCDISKRAVKEARLAGGAIDYALSEPNRLPYGDESFDAALIFDVLEHAAIPEALLGEVKRVLKLGGIFYCHVPCEADWLSLWSWLKKMGAVADLTEKYAGHINRFSRRELLRLLTEHGWKTEKKRCSEHLIGQLLGVAAFLLMERAAKKRRLGQINNEQFFERLSSQKGGLFILFKKFVNFAVNLESYFLSRLPSPNMHLVLKKSFGANSFL